MCLCTGLITECKFLNIHDSALYLLYYLYFLLSLLSIPVGINISIQFRCLGKQQTRKTYLKLNRTSYVVTSQYTCPFSCTVTSGLFAAPPRAV
nr:MAG TPA: hypothetical protein [Caudoviricetes sp.]